MMISDPTYKAKTYDLFGLSGISDETLRVHLGLYEGYVKAANDLREQLSEFMQKGKVDHEHMPAYSELTRRLGFEFNGMVLHEYYFGNLRRGGGDQPPNGSAFGRAIERTFGNYEHWKADFCSVGMMRGVGWAICNVDPARGLISNHWVSLHEHGNIAGFLPILVMDVWEHAYLLDYQPSERKQYIDSFFSNIAWPVVEERIQAGLSSVALSR
jgi:Fe-Mn family superoxide dismutase